MLGMFPWERRRLACFCAATKSTRLQTGRLRSQGNCPGNDDVLPQLFWSGRREAISTGPGLRLQSSLAGHLLPRRSEQLKRDYFVRAIPVGVVDDGLSGGRVHRCPGPDHGFPGSPEIRRFGTHGLTESTKLSARWRASSVHPWSASWQSNMAWRRYCGSCPPLASSWP